MVWFALACTFLASCLADPVPYRAQGLTEVPSGFWEGLGHGFFMLVNAVRGLTGDIFNANNSGWGYEAGYLLGSMVLGGVFMGFGRVGISWLMATDDTEDKGKALAAVVLAIVVVLLAFLIGDGSPFAPSGTGVEDLASGCGVGAGFWHRITGLVSLAGGLIWDDVTIYQLGCGSSYDIGYVLPQSIFGVLMLLAFVGGFVARK